MSIPNYCADFERQYDWLQIGTITVQNATLAVTGRDNASVVGIADANKVIWRPDEGTAAALIRFRVGSTASDGDSNVIEVYAAKGDDYYTRVGILTTQVGAQDWSSGHFIDIIALSSEQWSHGIRVETVTDEIGRVYLNTGGFDRFLFIASTLATPCTLYVDIVRLDKQIPLEAEILSAVINITGGVGEHTDLSDVRSAVLAMDSAISGHLSDVVAAVDAVEDITSDGFSLLLSALSGHQSDVAEQVNLVRSVLSDTIETTLTEINTSVSAMDSALSDQLSGIEVDIEATNTNLSGIESIFDRTQISATGSNLWLSDVASAADATRTAVDLVRSTLSDTIELTLTEINTSVSAMDSALSDQLSGIEVDIEAANTNLSGIESILDRTQISATNSDLWISDIASACDAVRAGITSGLSAQLSTLEDDVELVVVEVSTATSNLKTAVELTTTAVNLVRSTLSDTIAADLTGMQNQNSSLLTAIDGLSAQLSTLEDDAELIKTAVDLVRSTLSDTIATDLTGMQNQMSSLLTGVDVLEDAISDGLSNITDQLSSLTTAEEATTTAVNTVESAMSDGFSDIVDQNSSLLTAIDGLAGQNSSLLTAIDGLSAQLSTLEDDVELVVTEVSTAISNLKTNDDLIETGIRSGVKSAVIITDALISDLHSELTAATTFVSTGGGTEKITIPADPFQVAGAAQACREVIIYCPSGNVGTTYLQIGAVADVNDLPLHEDVWLSIPINNTNLLNFFGTAADIVYLLWRN